MNYLCFYISLFLFSYYFSAFITYLLFCMHLLIALSTISFYVTIYVPIDRMDRSTDINAIFWHDIYVVPDNIQRRSGASFNTAYTPAARGSTRFIARSVSSSPRAVAYRPSIGSWIVTEACVVFQLHCKILTILRVGELQWVLELPGQRLDGGRGARQRRRLALRQRRRQRVL